MARDPLSSEVLARSSTLLSLPPPPTQFSYQVFQTFSLFLDIHQANSPPLEIHQVNSSTTSQTQACCHTPRSGAGAARPSSRTSIVLEGFEIDGRIKLWRSFNGKPNLSSSQLPRSCPGVKRPWPNWHHAVPPAPTVATTGAVPSPTIGVNNRPCQCARKGNHPSPKMDLFLRTTCSLPLRRSDGPGCVLLPSQALPQPTDFTEG